MKVITEERFREKLKVIEDKDNVHDPYILGKISLLEDLLDECKEIDTLTVSKLRPMCDAPKDGKDMLCVINGSEEMYVTFYNEYKWEIPGVEMYLEDDSVVGWLPMPTYKPELTGE